MSKDEPSAASPDTGEASTLVSIGASDAVVCGSVSEVEPTGHVESVSDVLKVPQDTHWLFAGHCNVLCLQCRKDVT